MAIFRARHVIKINHTYGVVIPIAMVRDMQLKQGTPCTIAQFREREITIRFFSDAEIAALTPSDSSSQHGAKQHGRVSRNIQRQNKRTTKRDA